MTSTKHKFLGRLSVCRLKTTALFGAIMLMTGGTALAGELEEISYATASDGSVRVKLHLSEPVDGAQAFATVDPPRIAIDLPDTRNRVSERRIQVGSGATNTISAAESGGRTRVVIDLFSPASYETVAEGNAYVIDIGATAAGTATAVSGLAADPAKRINGRNPELSHVDFRRTAEGAARIVLDMSSENALIDLRSEGKSVILDMPGIDTPEALRQKLDVTDFATPVVSIESRQTGQGSRVAIRTTGEFETMAYQTGKQYVLEISPKVVPQAGEEAVGGGKEEKKGYSGTPVTFNFQEIPVRTVLQLIAEESGLNVVAADSVGGNVTLRLINVPWDQALDIVLRSKSLDKRTDGNVIWVAPQNEIAAYEQALADARIANEQRAELLTEYIPVNYGSAAEIAKLLTEDSKGGGVGGSQGAGGSDRGFLSPRGSVSFDARTNTLLVNDTAEKIAEIKELVALLDRPVDQVLIEARIVVASESFARELGARFGVSSARQEGNNTIISTTGSLAGAAAMTNNALVNRMGGRPGLPGIGDGVAPVNRLNVNLPVANPTGAIGFSILGADYLLDLELSALQKEGRGEVVSSPRVITSNQRPATISQGREVGYITVSGTGGNAQPTVNFKEALLELKVTPTITQDGRVFLDMGVKKDEIIGYVDMGALGRTPELAKREVTTAVLMDSGQTVVVGGVYEFSSQEDISKVPFLGDVPFLGNLFRKKGKNQTKAELLIFITPKILNVVGKKPE